MLYTNMLKSLGLHSQPSNPTDMIQLTRSGLPRCSARILQKKLHISTDELAHLLSVSIRSLQQVDKQSRFNSLVSGQLMSIAKVFARTAEVFESETMAAEWLKTSCRALGDNKPIELLDTPEGMELVLSVLEAITVGTVA